MNEALALLINHLADFRRAGVTSLEISESGGVKVSFRGDAVPGVLQVDLESAGDSRFDRDHLSPTKPEPPPRTSEELAVAHVA